MMAKLQFDDIWQSSAEVISINGKHQRIKTRKTCSADIVKINIYQDLIPGYPVWGWMEISAEEEVVLTLEMNAAQLLLHHTQRGLILESQGVYYWFPKRPRNLKQDTHGRISRWETMEWDIRCSNPSNLRFNLKLEKKDHIEIAFIKFDDFQEVKELQEFHAIEDTLWAVEGCWSMMLAPQDFWEFWALGEVYSGRFAKFGRFPSAQTAWSLYKVADTLERKTKKNLYKHVKAEIAYTILENLQENGAWPNGEWLPDMETHMRFQNDGIHLLVTAYEEFGDEMFLKGGCRAAEYVLANKDNLAQDQWWFLHDSLEMSAQIEKKYPQMRLHNAFGKHKWNTLTLNTHIQALTMLARLGSLTSNGSYLRAYQNGLRALRYVFESHKGKHAHKWAVNLISLSFENQPAPLLRRGIRKFVRAYLVPHFSYIQKQLPRFLTPNGYLWRDLTLPSVGYWYHLVNLYDLLVLYQMEQEAWLREVIDQAMAYTLHSNLVDYLIAQNHYIVPQWIQVLKAYSKISPDFDSNRIHKEVEKIKKHGYGVPPELFKPSGTYL